jgi:hypothetical protein
MVILAQLVHLLLCNQYHSGNLLYCSVKHQPCEAKIPRCPILDDMDVWASLVFGNFAATKFSKLPKELSIVNDDNLLWVWTFEYDR